MNRKKMRPLSTTPSAGKPAKSRRRIWIALILALLFIAIGYLISKQSEPETETPVSQSPSASMTEQTEAAQSAAMPENALLDDVENSATPPDNDPAASITKNTATPDPKAILNAPLPETDGLAKEEMDRLADEKQRFAEQEKLAAEQLVMNKQLTTMKAEQIKLLEQQIAQLEVETNGEK